MFGRPHTILAIVTYDPFENDWSDPVFDDMFDDLPIEPLCPFDE